MFDLLQQRQLELQHQEKQQQPEAGPISRPYNFPQASASTICVSCQGSSPNLQEMKHARRLRLRQNDVNSTASLPGSFTPSSSSSTTGLFVGPSTTSSQSTSSRSAISPTSASSSFTSSYTSSRTSGTATSTISRPWEYSTMRTISGTSSAQSSNVPGVILNLTLAGTSDTEAVYSVPMGFGHNVIAQSSRSRNKRKSDWDGDSVQSLGLQVDLGSSDLWVASDICTSSSCTGAPGLFNASASLDSGSSGNLTYQGGAISGGIYWEQVSVGGFGIGYQAFIAASQVTNENLSGGNFSGVLGLALPANSVILEKIPGTTSSNPDGATFLDNLFGSGTSAPSNRLFSLSLARREDVRTSSTLGVGAISNSLCPAPCNLTYVPIIAQPSLGITGYLFWRVPITAITVDTYSNPQAGTGLTSTSVVLGASQVNSQKSTPLAVLDSGGVQILVGYRPFADAIYSAAGISMSSDGYYRMPCTTPFSLTFTIGGQKYPVHPLDLSWADPSDPSQSTCIGAIQYSSTLGNSGDFILGSAFLKNVYSVFQYPDTNKQTTWQPTVGLYSLTNATVASQDFYSVRTLRQSLSSVSSAQQATTSGTTSPPASSQPATAAGSGAKSSLSPGVIAAIVIVVLLVLAAASFCLWFFWYRRKAPKEDEYYSSRPFATGHKSDNSVTSLRSKKHEKTARQKSMVEGFSDFEGDSWLSGTEGTDSIRLGYIPEVPEEEDDERGRRSGGRRDSVWTNSTAQRSSAGLAVMEDGGGENLIEMDSPRNVVAGAAVVAARRTSSEERDPSPSPHPRSNVLASPLGRAELPLRPQAAATYPPSDHVSSSAVNKSSSMPKSMSMSMQGPFPSPSRLHRPNDFFDLIPQIDPSSADPASAAAGAGHQRGRMGSRGSGGEGSGSGSGLGLGLGRRTSPSPANALGRRVSPLPAGLLGRGLTEEPTDT